jgi:hypothetical protein
MEREMQQHIEISLDWLGITGAEDGYHSERTVFVGHRSQSGPRLDEEAGAFKENEEQNKQAMDT